MNRIMFLARRVPARAATGLGAAGLVLAGLALTAAAVPAQAATLTHATAGSLSLPAPIAVNTANWSGSAGFGSRAPAWYKDRSGIVHLQGAAHQTSTTGTGANLLGILPKSAWPAANVFTIVHTFNGTYADLEVAANGQLNLIDPRSPMVKDYTFVSLEGITYRPSGTTSAISINTPFWSGSAGFGSRAPAWYKDRSGIVHLQGAAKLASGSTADPLGTLPPAARPSQNVFVLVHTFLGTYAVLDLSPDGLMFVDDPLPPAVEDLSFLSLEGISYRPAGTASAISLNTANWSGNNGFNVPAPGWYKDRSGIVHLQGAAKLISSTGTGVDTMGTLPTSARPSHNVFTVVLTGTDTYADLVIAANGQVNLIDPRPPAVRDYSFVSLAGITYRR